MLRIGLSHAISRLSIISILGAKIWKMLPNDYKELTSLSTFKSKIKNWEIDKCPCRLCKAYIHRVGFIWLSISTSDQCLLNIILLLYLFLFAVVDFFYYYYYLLLFIYFIIIIIIIINWYKLDCKFVAELCKFFKFQTKC